MNGQNRIVSSKKKAKKESRPNKNNQAIMIGCCDVL